MQTLIIIISSVLIGKVIAIYNYNLGFNLAQLLLFVFLLVPNLLSSTKKKHFRGKIEKYLRREGVDAVYLKNESFLNKFKRIFTSHVQIVFYLETPNRKKFVCGSWLFGVYNRNIEIYELSGGNWVWLETMPQR